MTATSIRAALMWGGLAVLMPGSLAFGQTAPICGTRGQAADRSNVVATWSITVSNEGLPCMHERLVGRGDLYQVIQPPAHGQIPSKAGDPELPSPTRR